MVIDFKDINKADKAALNSGDFASVYFDDAIKRLKNICSVDIGPHKEILDKIRDDRNRLEHFQITLSKEAAISNVVKAWTFVLDFASSHLDFSKDPNSILLFEKIKTTIVIHEQFVNERLKFITPDIEANNSEKYPYTVIDCPECFHDSLFLKAGYSECLFCRTKEDWKKTMEKWLIVHEGYRYFDLKERSIDPLIHECPECSHEGMFRFEDGDPQPPDPAAICFHCGVSIDFCEWCYYSDVCPTIKMVSAKNARFI